MDTLTRPLHTTATQHHPGQFEVAFKKCLMDQLKPRVPEALENSVEAIADVLVDQIAAGTDYDDLDVSGHIESWAEERR
ncbi:MULTISPECIES: hypothetical protein [Glycomyces]|uniref:Uncharacterized protein n=2 Tax=Glycomyces TaxID=58113 RepID=A0ABU2AHU5_9ACTN|nr:hypothetical protein [Glycomyces lechevalierae]MDR7336782.1 hypothetical protein [Glycomyces lechevalierae]